MSGRGILGITEAKGEAKGLGVGGLVSRCRCAVKLGVWNGSCPPFLACDPLK